MWCFVNFKHQMFSWTIQVLYLFRLHSSHFANQVRVQWLVSRATVAAAPWPLAAAPRSPTQKPAQQTDNTQFHSVRQHVFSPRQPGWSSGHSAGRLQHVDIDPWRSTPVCHAS